MRKSKIIILASTLILTGFMSFSVSADSTKNLLEENYITWRTEQNVAISKQNADVSTSQEIKNLNESQSVTYNVTAPTDGLYRIKLTYLSTADSLINPEFSIKINGKNEFYESRNITAPTLWKNKSANFLTNESGNDLVPEQVVDKKVHSIILNDTSFDQQDGLLFYLKKGENTLELTMIAGTMSVYKLSILKGTDDLPTYQNYLSALTDKSSIKNLISFEAEKTFYKDNSYAQPQRMKTPAVSPYSSSSQLLNVFGGDSWSQSGQGVTWKFNVDKTGTYTLTVKNQQNNNGKPVFRTIAIDGKIPFKALQAYRFDTNSGWTNSTLGNAHTTYQFYLTKGEHTLTMTATDAPVSKQIAKIDDIMKSINDLGLQVQKLTGNNTDTNTQWDIKQYIPNVDKQFNGWLSQLKTVQTQIEKIYGKKNNKAQELVQLRLVIKQLKNIAKSPNKLPDKLQDLSQGSASVTNTLATIEQDLEIQPLTIDKFYLSANERIPSTKVGFFKNMSSTIGEFFSSFSSKSTNASHQKVITVWVERSQQYVDLMQSMTDSEFTPKTGIKVDFQIMPDESKLLLASASGEAPDVALGVSTQTPYNLALRGAVLPLNSLSGFKETAKEFSPGALVPLMIGNDFYGLPETQDFYVQFTRNDILQKLDIPQPDDWNQVLSILPELQRYGMNYYIPLSGTSGTKAMMFTAPFVFQFGGKLYSNDGTKTAINSSASINGLKFMTDLYTTYSLPLQVNSFYNSFRYGQIPIGISNFQTYVQLKSAAPEIANEWSIQPYPGVLEKDGTINRSATGSAQDDMIFKSTKHKNEAWKFLQWWVSSGTQAKFATQLQTTYGPSYMWNTANLKAFNQLPWPAADKKAILEQWKWLEEAPQTPAGYMEEREISNVWTDVVFSGQNIRSAVENNSIIINKEITSRLTDFGYIKNGKKVKSYQIPTIPRVKELLGEN